MHDQAAVAFNFGHVLVVIVDAVTIESQRRVAKQQHVIRHDLALPGRALFRRHGRRCRVARLGSGAVHDVVFLGQRQALGVMNFVLHKPNSKSPL